MSRKFDLNNLDFNNSGAWPMPVKVVACLLIIIVIVFLIWWTVISAQQDELAALETTEKSLQAEFEKEAAKAANLEPLKLQLAQMEQMLQQMLRQLPGKTEMADLLIDISQTALASGISTDLFQPGPEAKKDFYAEKPISIRMTGSYHQFGQFVSGVAS